MFYARVDYLEKRERLQDKTLEYVHRPVWHDQKDKLNEADVP